MKFKKQNEEMRQIHIGQMTKVQSN